MKEKKLIIAQYIAVGIIVGSLVNALSIWNLILFAVGLGLLVGILNGIILKK